MAEMRALATANYSTCADVARLRELESELEGLLRTSVSKLQDGR